MSGSRIWNLVRLGAILLPLSLAGCRENDFPQYPPNYREYVYVTNGGSDTVTVLDVVDVRVDRELAVGHDPVALAASPTRNEIYVVNAGAAGTTGSLSVIDAEHNTVSATIPLHRQPVSIDLNAAGTVAYIANTGSNSISVTDLEHRREVAQIGVGEEPVAARLDPDGKTLVVANRHSGSVSLIDAASGRARAAEWPCPCRVRRLPWCGGRGDSSRFNQGVCAVLGWSPGDGDCFGSIRCSPGRAGSPGDADGRGARACSIGAEAGRRRNFRIQFPFRLRFRDL
ncbi:hypothetical protein SBA5_10086 [Candidatus Sulfotelmatomonas gaucii]|uniref:YncE family protein n=1 Tax=Candidatus Sulfuritelmatomonas gaucii TaxID=2043161 RepID=A0A2N9L2C0_9BACT|nr:hypothetical protein SBA5_10086 [Candidatus Sulfotelmatomonas gaucii]